MRISAIDRKILNGIQEDIPIIHEPFKVMSKRVGLGEGQLLKRIKRLKDKGLIRSLNGHINHRKLKFRSTLVAFRIPEEKVEAFAKKISSRPEVTHCFLRRGDYNLWTVFIYKNKSLETFLKKMAKQVGKKNILNLPTERQFKLKTTIKL